MPARLLPDQRSETILTFHRTIRLGDRITARVVFDGFDGPEQSRFAGRRIKDYLRQEYRNQDDELVATFICSRVRFERSEAQTRAPSRSVEVPHPWTDDEILAIEEDVLAETPRGTVPRTGNPNNPTLPVWKPYSDADRQMMVLNVESHLEVDPGGQARAALDVLPYFGYGYSFEALCSN